MNINQPNISYGISGHGVIAIPEVIISADRLKPTPAAKLNNLYRNNTSIGQYLIGRDVDEIISQLRDNVAAGKEGEDIAGEIIVEAGYTIIGQQIYVRTPLGLRITDFLAINPAGELTGFEVKTGYSSRYTPSQRAKDEYIQNYGGTLVSRSLLGGGLQYGDQLKYHTLWVYILGGPI